MLCDFCSAIFTAWNFNITNNLPVALLPKLTYCPAQIALTKTDVTMLPSFEKIMKPQDRDVVFVGPYCFIDFLPSARVSRVYFWISREWMEIFKYFLPFSLWKFSKWIEHRQNIQVVSIMSHDLSLTTSLMRAIKFKCVEFLLDFFSPAKFIF